MGVKIKAFWASSMASAPFPVWAVGKMRKLNQTLALDLRPDFKIKIIGVIQVLAYSLASSQMCL